MSQLGIERDSGFIFCDHLLALSKGFDLWEVLLRWVWRANICQIVHAVRSINGILIIFDDLANIEAFSVLFQIVVSEPLTFVAGNRVIYAAQPRRLLVAIQRWRVCTHLRHPLLDALLLDIECLVSVLQLLNLLDVLRLDKLVERLLVMAALCGAFVSNVVDLGELFIF